MHEQHHLYDLSELSVKTTLALLISAGLIYTGNAYAKGEFADSLGVSGQCTLCHTSSEGGLETLRPAAKQAFLNGGLTPGLANYVKALKNTKPVLLPIDNQWNVQVGELPLSIPLSVKDKEANSFVMQLANAGSANAPKGHSFSKPYTLASNRLPTINFIWKPTAAQKNKNYAAIFNAKENTGGGTTQLSNAVSTNIFVWPARPVSNKYVISQFNVDSAKWAANKLTLAGRIVFKKTASAAAKNAALKALRLTLKSNREIVVGTPVRLNPNASGAWTSVFALSATKVPCLVKARYENLNAARTVKPTSASCLK